MIDHCLDGYNVAVALDFECTLREVLSKVKRPCVIVVLLRTKIPEILKAHILLTERAVGLNKIHILNENPLSEAGGINNANLDFTKG